MKYPISTAIGDAGEFFAAYKIARELGWPCRLFDIDIGIDAQVEILTDERESTGRFVALQVKATSAEEMDCRYVSKKQLKYWLSLEIPVFLVLVNLQNEQMFLHLIEASRDYEVTKGGKHKITFDLASELFTKESASVLTQASERLAMLHIEEYLREVNVGITQILQEIKNFEDDSPDAFELINVMESRHNLFNLLNQAEAAAAVTKVGFNVIGNCKNELLYALHDLQSVMDGMEADWSDMADISGFLREPYPTYPISMSP
ncbi:DUF4365 domain-containing protein [Methylovorus sp. SPW-M1]